VAAGDGYRGPSQFLLLRGRALLPAAGLWAELEAQSAGIGSAGSAQEVLVAHSGAMPLPMAADWPTR
jgi:hypothetical protein